jgi:hypothetical protein
MKARNLIPLIIGIVTGTLVSSCERSTHKKVEDRIDYIEDHPKTENNSRVVTPAPVATDHTTVNDNPSMQNDKDLKEFREEIRARIKENEKDIADFRQRMRNEGKDFSSRYGKKIDRLEEKNRNLKERLENYKEEGNTNWQKFKREFNHDMDELGKSLKDLGRDNVK